MLHRTGACSRAPSLSPSPLSSLLFPCVARTSSRRNTIQHRGTRKPEVVVLRGEERMNVAIYIHSFLIAQHHRLGHAPSLKTPSLEALLLAPPPPTMPPTARISVTAPGRHRTLAAPHARRIGSEDEGGIARVARALVPVAEKQPLVGREVKLHALAFDAHVAVAVFGEMEHLIFGQLEQRHARHLCVDLQGSRE